MSDKSRNTPGYSHRKDIKTVLLPLDKYPFWFVDLRMKATYYHKKRDKMKANISRLLVSDRTKTFKLCPNYQS